MYIYRCPYIRSTKNSICNIRRSLSEIGDISDQCVSVGALNREYRKQKYLFLSLSRLAVGCAISMSILAVSFGSFTAPIRSLLLRRYDTVSESQAYAYIRMFGRPDMILRFRVYRRVCSLSLSALRRWIHA